MKLFTLYMVILIGILNFNLIAFAIAAPKNDFPFELFWQSSQPQVVKMNWGTYSTEIERRIIPAPKNKYYPVATVTTSTVNYNSDSVENPLEYISQVKELVQKTYQVKKWSTVRRANYEVFEGASSKSGQLVKLFISASKKQVQTSLATLDAPFAGSVYYEAEYKQRMKWENSLSNSKSKGKTSDFWFKSIVGDASFAVTINIGTGGMTTARLQGATNAMNRAAGAVNNISSTVGTVANTVSTSVTTAASTVGTSINNLAGSANNLSASQNNLSTSARSMNDTLKRFQDPGVMAKAGAAFGLGFGIGSAAGSLIFQSAWDVGVSGMRTMFYGLTGMIKPEMREKMTKEALNALDQLEPLSQQIEEMNFKSAALMLAMKQTEGRSPTVVALENKKRIEDLERKILEDEKVFNSLGDAAKACAADNIALSKMSLKLVKEAQKALDQMSEGGPSICNEYENLQRNVAMVQLQLKNSRDILIDAIPLLSRQMYDDSKRAERGEEGFFGASKASERELRNACPDDEIQKLNSKVQSLDNCNCKQAKENTTCSFVCSSLQSAQEIKSMCLDSVKVAGAVDKDKQQAERLALLSANVSALRTMQNRLVEGLCSPAASECNGKSGEVSLVTNALKKRVETGVNACRREDAPSDMNAFESILKVPPVTVEVQKTAELAGERAADVNVPVSELSPEQRPQSSTDVTSFFKGLFHKLTFGLFA